MDHLVGPFPVRTTYSNYYSYRLDYGLTVTPAQFSQQIGFLQSHGYTSISLNRLADDLLYGLPLPPRPVILTFDDGFLSEYQNAVPILAAANYTAVFFPCTGLIGATSGHEAYMTASDLVGLANSGSGSRITPSTMAPVCGAAPSPRWTISLATPLRRWRESPSNRSS